jgi:hypothetical protein
MAAWAWRDGGLLLHGRMGVTADGTGAGDGAGGALPGGGSRASRQRRPGGDGRGGRARGGEGAVDGGRASLLPGLD